MRTVPANQTKPPPAAPLTGRPSARSLLRWGALVLVLHLGLLLSLAGTLDWQLSTPQTLRTGPMQTRSIGGPSAAPTANALNPTPAARTRVALVEKPKPTPPQKHTTPTTVTSPKKQPTAATVKTAPSAANQPEPTQTPDLETEPNPANPTPLDSSPPQPQPQPQPHLAPPVNVADITENPLVFTAGPQTSDTLSVQATALAVAAVSASPASSDAALSAASPGASASSAQNPTPNPTPRPTSESQVSNSSAPSLSPALTPTPLPTESASFSASPPTASSDAATQPATPATERIANATQALPELALASLPPSALLSYRLFGQEKGINYQASGELRWQRNDSAYAMSLSVRAFLLGSRHWRSVGQINTTGLAPTRFSDSWRSERAAHFDRPQQRIVFSNNAPTVPLQPGAQDQVSLYVQLAAAMAQSGQSMPPGTRLQIQTATVRDALPWLLTLEKQETLQVDGQSLQTVKWVCQPRNRFDAQVEFWVSAAHDWLPARIRITQVSGSFIDLQLTGREALADLPPVQ